MAFYKILRINGIEYPLAVNITGHGSPTTRTVGAIGQTYIDIDDEIMYICINVNNNTYTWERIDRIPGKKTSDGGEIFNDYENNQAISAFSHAEGKAVTASGEAQHVQGQFNIADNEKSTRPGFTGSTYRKYAHIVGNGTDKDNRSNAHTLDWDGNAWFAGDVTVTTENGELNIGKSIEDIKENLKNPSYEEDVKLTGITTAEGDIGAYISDNELAGAGNTFHIDITGYIKFHCEVDNAGGNATVMGVTLGADTGVYEYSFEGVVENGFNVSCSFVGVTFTEFVKKVYVKDAIGDMDTALDAILAIQESIVGGVEQ